MASKMKAKSEKFLKSLATREDIDKYLKGLADEGSLVALTPKQANTVFKFVKVAEGKGYEQGKKDERERQNPRLDNMYKQAKQVGFSQARKQTYEEVLKQWKNMSWNVAHLLFEYGAYKKYKFAIIALKEVDVIVQEKKSELEHKIKALKEVSK